MSRFASRFTLPLLLAAACGTSTPEPHDADGGVQEDAGEAYLFVPTLYRFVSATEISPGDMVYEDTVAQVSCAQGAQKFSPSKQPQSVTVLSDPDAPTLLSALATPSGEGFLGLDDSFGKFVEDATAPHAMTVFHVHRKDAGVLSFDGAPEPTDAVCGEGYVQSITLGARMVVGVRLVFGTEQALSAFRAEYPGLGLEAIMPQVEDGSLWTYDRSTKVEVFMARIGGSLDLDLLSTRTDCTESQLSECAVLLDELNLHAQEFIAALPVPAVGKLGEWGDVRLDVSGVPAAADSL